MLFEKGINIFLENCMALEKSPKTIYSYKIYLNKLNSFLSELYNCPVYIHEVKPEDVERFIFQHFNPRCYSPSTRHGVITAFRSMYSYLDRKNLCENKGKLIKNVKVTTDERETINDMEFRKIIRNVKAATTRAVLHTLYNAGLRISEALNLKMEDVDLERDVLHIKNAKNKEVRTVPINTRLKKVLEDYLSNGRVDCRTDNFFSTYPQGQICSQAINKQLRKALIKAEVNKKITAHSLRHSFASNLILRGVDVVTLRKLLGHKDIQTTSIYCHATLDELAAAINVL